MTPLDLTNQRFGRLLVVSPGGYIRKCRAWLCRCDCGTEKTIITSNLRGGTTLSCGCLNRELTSARFTTHGLTGTKAIERIYNQARRARILASGGTVSAEDVSLRYATQDGHCFYCRKVLALDQMELDHVVPLSRGGSHTPGNVQLLCRRCNRRKHARCPISFLSEVWAL